MSHLACLHWRRVSLLRPIPRSVSRPLSAVVVVVWLAQMAVLLQRSVLSAAPVSLAADLASYGGEAQWRGIYYKGEKIGFSVSQTVPEGDGYELQEDGQLQMTLLGATTAARLSTRVRVDKAFSPRSFSFSLDPGTGPLEVEGRLDGLRLELEIATASGTRSETRLLEEAPQLSLNLSRRLAAQGLESGQRHTFSVFDPATLRNAPMTVEVGTREVLRIGGRPLPAFKVTMQFSGISSTAWITDVGEVVREESPMGMLVVREPRETAMALAVSREIQLDLYDAAAVVPKPARRIDDPGSVELLRVRLRGADLSSPDVQGAGQSVQGNQIEIRDARDLPPVRREPGLERYLAPETFLESDAPEIVAEAQRATAGLEGDAAKAERLVRHVNALLEKRPTVSLPSALEVLRTRVGDCNEHTALFVALARAAGIPSRIAVGLVNLRGAFYYHAWPEVWLEAGAGRGRWIPVDPTLNQFPADLTHIRLARGGLDRQAAIVGMIGRLEMEVLEMEMAPGTAPILVGRDTAARPFDIAIPSRGARRGCWSRP
jgi:hypothetical protein